MHWGGLEALRKTQDTLEGRLYVSRLAWERLDELEEEPRAREVWVCLLLRLLPPRDSTHG